MLNREEELSAFKREINLAEYAVSHGYALDPRASSRSSLLMRHPNGDKLVIAQDTDHHWIYFSVRDDTDNGTIVDFVQRRSGGSLGEVRKQLRAWLGSGAPHVFATDSPSIPLALEPCSPNLLAIRGQVEAMSAIECGHDYLEQARKIPREVLEHPRFAGRVLADGRGNAIFPHWNADGLCGYEIKNQGFTGFSPGGRKGIWVSNVYPGDMALVVTESGIDALSHFALRLPEGARYLSIAGALNDVQPHLIRDAVNELPSGSQVIIATDNDEGGDRLLATIRDSLPGTSSHVSMLEDRPGARGTDWNDVLPTQSNG